MKKINILSIINILISVGLLFFIVKLNILPIKYLLLIIGIILIGNIFIVFLLNRKHLIFKIIGILLSLVLIIGNGVGIYYIENTSKLFSSLIEVKEESIYYVVVNKSSNYNKLKDLDNKTIGTIENDSKNYQKALKNIKNTISIKNKDYDNTFKMFSELLDNSLESILINSNNYDISCENNSNIKNNTKVIEKIRIEVIKQKEKEYKNSKGTYNILISGIDTNGDISKVSRSDVNIIITVNPNTKEILLTNIPRDMEVQLHGTTGLTDKLTHSGIYGIDMTKSTIEDFLETDINYYVRVNFDSVVEIIDAIGGVDLYNDRSFSTGRYTFSKGNIHLNGKQALAYSRDRKHQEAGDWSRGLHQMEVIKAIINKVTHSTELLTSYSDLVNVLGKFVQTNIPDKEIKKQVRNQLDTMPSWSLYSQAVAGSGYSYQQTYSMPGMNLYVTHKDESSRKNCSKVINGIINGKEYNSIK